METHVYNDPLVGKIQGRKVYQYCLLDMYGKPISVSQRVVLDSYKARDAFLFKVMTEDYRRFLEGKLDKYNAVPYEYRKIGWYYEPICENRKDKAVKSKKDSKSWDGAGIYVNDAIESYYYCVDLLGRAQFNADILVPNSLKLLKDLTDEQYYLVTGRKR